MESGRQAEAWPAGDQLQDKTDAYLGKGRQRTEEGSLHDSRPPGKRSDLLPQVVCKKMKETSRLKFISLWLRPDQTTPDDPGLDGKAW